MSRVLIIGIDALDSVMLARFGADLPHFKALNEKSPHIRLTSVYPPDSDTAWASIYTGLNPAKHGIVHFVDPLEKSSIITSEEINNSSLCGNTFWDLASSFGKKVCLILPHVGYPVWKVNGVMVARSAITKDVQVSPYSISKEYQLSLLAGIKGFPGRRQALGKYIEAHRRLICHEAEFSLKMLKNYDWDLFFTYSSSLDMIQHFFWNYCDENDPTYPGDNPYKNVIRDFYKLYDEIVGEFIATTNTDTAVIVQSDHGHSMRPVKLVNINEYLRRKGFLVPRTRNLGTRSVVRLIERSKIGLTDFMAKHQLGSLGRRLMFMFPSVKRIYTSPLSIDWQKSVACVTDLSGIKAYSYGGVRIIKKNIRDTEYEEVRRQLVEDLSEFREPNTGERLMKWACSREALYSGKHISKYPDIVFELESDYGAGWAVHAPLLGTSHSHNFVPGSHKGDSGVFLMSNLGDRQVVRDSMTLMDVAPTILDILDVEGNFNFDGRSILK